MCEVNLDKPNGTIVDDNVMKPLWTWLRSCEVEWQQKLMAAEKERQKEIDNFNDELSEKDDIISNLQEDIRKKEQKNNKEVIQSTALKTEIELLRSQLTTKTEEFSKLETDLKSTRDELDKSIKEKQTLSSKCDKFRQEQETIVKYNDSLKAEIKKLKIELQTMSSAKEVDFQASSKTVSDLGSQLLLKETELQSITLELMKKIEELESSQKQLDAARAESKNVKPNLVKIEADCAKIHKLNSRLIKENDALRTEFKDLKWELTKQQGKYLELVNSKSYRESYKKIASELRDKIKLVSELQKKSSDRDRLEVDFKLQLSETKEKYQAMQAERFVLKQAVCHLRAERRNDKSRITSPVKKEDRSRRGVAMNAAFSNLLNTDPRQRRS